MLVRVAVNKGLCELRPFAFTGLFRRMLYVQ
jgi:hypothetical protein